MATPSLSLNPSPEADETGNDLSQAPNALMAPQQPPVPRWRAYSLLFIFSMAQLLDIFNVTAPTVALPHIGEDLDVTFAERQWAINAYALTFGAFLLTVSTAGFIPIAHLKNLK